MLAAVVTTIPLIPVVIFPFAIAITLEVPFTIEVPPATVIPVIPAPSPMNVPLVLMLPVAEINPAVSKLPPVMFAVTDTVVPVCVVWH